MLLDGGLLEVLSITGMDVRRSEAMSTTVSYVGSCSCCCVDKEERNTSHHITYPAALCTEDDRTLVQPMRREDLVAGSRVHWSLLKCRGNAFGRHSH